MQRARRHEVVDRLHYALYVFGDENTWRWRVTSSDDLRLELTPAGPPRGSAPTEAEAWKAAEAWLGTFLAAIRPAPAPRR